MQHSCPELIVGQRMCSTTAAEDLEKNPDVKSAEKWEIKLLLLKNGSELQVLK